MDTSSRKMVEGWLDKASAHHRSAEGFLGSYFTYSESIEAAQECIELSVKSVLEMLSINYPSTHGWNKDQIAKVADQIQERKLLARLTENHLEHAIRLPRLLFLVNFWSQFYLLAKYGFEAAHLAPAQALFDKEEADLAVKHAGECLRAAQHLRYLPDEKFSSLLV